MNSGGGVSLDDVVSLEDLVGVGGPALAFSTNGLSISSSGASTGNFSFTSFSVEGVNAVPEPGTTVLALGGCFGLLLMRKYKQIRFVKR